MNKLRLMAFFVNIVESGSISKAAEKMALSKSVVSSALKSLESELGTCLITRTTRRQRLTPTGESFYHQCSEMLKQAESAWQAVSNEKQTPSGKLTVTAPCGLMRSLVLPALAKVFMPFPDLHLNLLSDDQHLNISQSNVDIAIRVGSSQDSNLKQRKIGSFSDVLCQAKNSSVNILDAPYIAHQWQTEPITHQYVEGARRYNITHKVRHKANTVLDVIAMIELGLGIGLVPEQLAMHNPRLEIVAGFEAEKSNPIYALHPYFAHAPIAVTMAIAAIEDEMKCW
ncbi:LysR family transcriptional regulator [Vibrio sp. S4M6]|uniref:LysR family transcriptional regulator n=1 Tax=Vibrio sinus TaxID=2946865 RepID=UPI002029B7C7|nr:LysR family transcriptional regulator [Vibrio sinus]MCL9782912.1 LysR family transcriptional regulator [Vibrio sinus]